MKNLMFIFICFVITPIFSEETPDFLSMLKRVDIKANFDDNDFSATLNMISEDPETGITKREVTMFRRDSEDLFLMLTLAPSNKKGQGTLKVGNNIWRYDPESRKFSHHTKEEKYEETSARNSDFSRSTLADDYNVTSFSSGKLGKYDVWIVELIAVDENVTYPYRTAYIDKERELVLKMQEYSLSRRLVRSIYTPSYAKIGDKYVATKMIMVDELIEGKKTTMSVTDLSVGTLPDNVFTKSYLERVSR